ncbi:hypothetical protein Nmel_012355 [Mimus melanotis]
MARGVRAPGEPRQPL